MGLGASLYPEVIAADVDIVTLTCSSSRIACTWLEDIIETS